MKILGVETGSGRRAQRGRPGTLGHLLERNAALRDVFAGEPARRQRLAKLQKWQSKRLLRSHEDLHRDPRYRLAVEFFFNALYGGGDPRARDRDLLKVQRVMERLLPAEALESPVPRDRTRNPVAGTRRRSGAGPPRRPDHRTIVRRGVSGDRTPRRTGSGRST